MDLYSAKEKKLSVGFSLAKGVSLKREKDREQSPTAARGFALLEGMKDF